MTLREKLTTIAENIPLVYEAGKASGGRKWYRHDVRIFQDWGGDYYVEVTVYNNDPTSYTKHIQVKEEDFEDDDFIVPGTEFSRKDFEFLENGIVACVSGACSNDGEVVEICKLRLDVTCLEGYDGVYNTYYMEYEWVEHLEDTVTEVLL